MTREEHLKKIVERCELAIESNKLDAGIETSIAGWKSTIAAINSWQKLENNCRGWKDDNGCAGAALQHYHCAIDSIISAWPEELL